MADDRLADDADALADLGAAPAGQLLVEQVLVDTLALGAAVLLGPGHAQPAPLPEGGHEGPALGGVDDLGHVLPGQVEDLGVVIGVEEALDLLHEGQLLRREFEVHRLPPGAPSGPDLTGRQIRTGILGHAPRSLRSRSRERGPNHERVRSLLLGAPSYTAPVTRGARIAVRIGLAIFGIGLLLVAFVAYQLWGTALYEAQAQSHLKSELATQLHHALPSSAVDLTGTQRLGLPPLAHQTATPSPEPALGQPVGLLSIPKIGILDAIVEGVGEAQLEQGPGHYQGTALPGTARQRRHRGTPHHLRPPVLQPRCARPRRQHLHPHVAGSLRVHGHEQPGRAPDRRRRSRLGFRQEHLDADHV